MKYSQVHSGSQEHFLHHGHWPDLNYHHVMQVCQQWDSGDHKLFSDDERAVAIDTISRLYFGTSGALAFIHQWGRHLSLRWAMCAQLKGRPAQNSGFISPQVISHMIIKIREANWQDYVNWQLLSKSWPQNEWCHNKLLNRTVLHRYDVADNSFYVQV